MLRRFRIGRFIVTPIAPNLLLYTISITFKTNIGYETKLHVSSAETVSEDESFTLESIPWNPEVRLIDYPPPQELQE